ncbi:MAG: hypothetical protein WKG00_38995 [Polyangiaceae bacterium]
MQLDDDYARRYMLPGERLLFGEKIVSRGIFKTTMVLCATLALVGLVASLIGLVGPAGSGPGLALGIPFIGVSALLAALSVLFSVFRSMVTTSHLQVHFGWAKRKVPLQAIENIAIVPYVGAKQGKVSMGFDGVVRTWVGTPSSGRGVEVTYLGGKRKHVLTIGSDDVERFAEALQQARAAATSEPATAPAASRGRGRRRVAVEGRDGAAAQDAEDAFAEGGSSEPEARVARRDVS